MSATSLFSSPKLLASEAAPALFDALRQQGKKLVQCHGTFDLIHPGQVMHLEEARSLGDILVVTINAEKSGACSSSKPFFNDQLRARSLAALSCVDYVVMMPSGSACDAIACVKPHFYCLGRESEDEDGEGNGSVAEECRTVRQFGGQVHHTSAASFRSSRLLNRYFDHLTVPVKDFCRNLAAKVSPADFRQAVKNMAELKVLIIGDTIFDRYSYLKVQGLTSKNLIISGRYLREETQCGGALAVFRHVKQFNDRVKFLSLLGTESWVEPLLRQHVSADEDLTIRDDQFTTIIKQRYVEPLSEGKELAKLFAVNYLDAHAPAESVLHRIQARIEEAICEVDVVMLFDFGHGLLQPAVRELVQQRAPFLALNCQTNSNNFGFNVINRRYQRADAFALDEQELMLACGHRHLDYAGELDRLRQQLKARYAWLTRGRVQTIGLKEGEAPSLCPPFENEVVDTVGAGDAYFSVAALAAARGLPIELATFLGQLAGAQAVRIVGNSEPVSKSLLLKSGASLLEF
jgi:bifunctional ADP-heptose synthase (sugar kinase/adenylyltransferase)